MPYYAHSKEDAPEAQWHLLHDHLYEVASLAESYATHFGLAQWGRALGLLHDCGKYSQEFQQQRLRGGGGRVDHTTAGCRIAIEHYGEDNGRLMSYAIAGHHGGLPNWHEGKSGGLKQRLYKKLPEYAAWENEITLPECSSLERIPKLRSSEELSFLVRLLYSALVDADHTDTHRFYHGAGAEDTVMYPLMSELLSRCTSYLQTLQGKALNTEINQLRCQIADRAQEIARMSPPGLFTFTAPTGAGKTLASLLFALTHAVEHGLRRVVLVIPYISIIEQNAAVFRKVLGDNVVLEHHSSFDPGEGDSYIWRHGQETWDAPIIVTTAVQFFESLYTNQPSRSRKLHNLARSVIVLDEVQTLPIHLLQPCIKSLQWLTNSKTVGSSVVLSTATQPALDAQSGFPTMDQAKEISLDTARLFTVLRRNRIQHLGLLQDEDLVERLHRYSQYLCILNTRAHARQVFEAMETDGCYHLSAAMCPAHRSYTLEQISRDLADGKPCGVISTSLVEAGVDLDFPVVFRAAGGLDSIAQAAGRCNREGKRKSTESIVYVFDCAEKPIPDLKLRAEICEEVCYSAWDTDILRPDMIETYFRRLYSLRCQDRHDIGTKLGNNKCEWSFQRAARAFRLIDEEMCSVIVPWGDLDYVVLDEMIERENIKKFSRRLQKYTVQIHRQHYDWLIRASVVQFLAKFRFGDRFPILINEDLYDTHLGLYPRDPDFRKAESNIL